LKFYNALFFYLFLSISINAQESALIDSLKNRISNSKTDSALSYEYDVLAKEYSGINPDSGILYSNKSLELSRKINNYRFQVDALNTLGIIYRERGEFNSALDLHHQALSIAQNHKLSSHYFESTYSSLNLAYTEQGNYTVGIAYGFKALKEIEKNGDTLSMALANNNIANTYFQIREYKKAMKHYNIALMYAIAIKHLYGQSLLAGNMGSVLYEMGKLDSAKIYFEKAVLLNKQVGDKSGEAINYTNLGSYYQRINDNQSAIDYFLKAEKIFAEMKMQPNIADAFYNLATSYLELKDYRKSESYAKQSLEIANKIESYPHKEQAHLALKNVYEKTNDPAKAYFHYKEYIAAKDSVFNEKNKKEQFKAELVYEYDKKRYSDSLDHAVAIKIQQAQLNQEREKTEAQKRFTYAATGVCLLLLVFASYIFKNYKDKQKANKIISEQKDQVEIQKQKIELQKTILETRNKEVTDSINYAKRLQEAILPPENFVRKFLPESFIFYKPKDIVAGDFYWLEVVATPDVDLVMFAAADCTGHGVPGAIVSVVCSNALNRTIKELTTTDPGKILDKTREHVIDTFERKDLTSINNPGEVKDGMDISLCVLNKKINELQWAGANNPLWIIRDKNLIEYKPNKQPIGKVDSPVPFTTHVIQLEKNDRIYLFSDGFADQFGGDKGKKFKLSNLKELLRLHSDLPMSEQSDNIELTLKNWQGNLEQVDDILIIGFSI
jgi:serine phosphatase RsbU (regulator of sigma subunit)